MDTIDETTRLPHNNTMPKHLHQKLGKPTEFGQKTPSRGGLGMVINESKTPGAKSIQKMVSSARKNTMSLAPVNSGFEIFEDLPDELDQSERAEEQVQSPDQQFSSGSPLTIEKANRCSSFDSLGAEIANEMLEWQRDNDVILTDEPFDDSILYESRDSITAEIEALGIEPWDEYPPIEIASRLPLPDPPFTKDDFPHDDAILVEDVENYPNPFPNYKSSIDPLLVDEVMAHLFNVADELDQEELIGGEFVSTFF